MVEDIELNQHRRKHTRSKTTGSSLKDKASGKLDIPNDPIKSLKDTWMISEAQKKLEKLDISNEAIQNDGLGQNKRRRMKRTKSTDDKLNHDAETLLKKRTGTEENVLTANLYTKDKNKSYEKEAKLSYMTTHQKENDSIKDSKSPIKTANSEQKDKRQNKTKREVEIAAAVETAVDVDKVRRRRKKQEKTKTNFNVQDEVDGSQGSSKTHKDAKFNRGYDIDAHKDTEASGETSKARENLGYEVEQETGETSKELGTMEKSKTEKRRRKKPKESSADVIHRALEKKRQDDGHVMCIVIHKTDRLQTDLMISHPLVRVHILDMTTGEYVKKCNRNRAVTSYYENQETVDYILPLMTQPFDFKQRKSLVPCWEDVLIINEIYSYFLQREESDPDVIIFFEILDFLSMAVINKQRRKQGSERGWYQIAWAFLKLIGANGSLNTEQKIRLQLFHPVKLNRRQRASKQNTPEVYDWWKSTSRDSYPSTLYVTVKGVKPPKEIDAAGRSMFPVQQEKGRMTYEELTGGITRTDVSKDLDSKTVKSIAWSKLPGQPNHLPNRLMLTMNVGNRGCFVVRFSRDGRKLACGCAGKDGFAVCVYETLTGNNMSTFHGHFSIIYDLCWSFDDTTILSASSDGTARSWDVKNNVSTPVKTYPHPSFVYTAQYHPQRKNIVVTGGFDRLMRIWSNDCEGMNGQLLREMEGHGGFINTICFHPTGQFMYSGDSLGTVIIWNTFEYGDMAKSKKRRPQSAADVQRWVISKTVKEPEIKDCIINSVRLHPNGQKLLVHTRDSVTRMLDLRSFSVMTRYIGAKNFKEHVRSTMSTCGSFVFSGSEDGAVYAWNTETSDQIKVYNNLGYTCAVSDLDFHPHDDIIAFCSYGYHHPVILYHFKKTGELLGETPAHIPVNPPPSSLPLTNRTLVRSPNDAGTSEEQKAKHTSQSFADVASETLLLNKIKKKLESVLDISNSSNMLDATTFTANQRTPSPFATRADSLTVSRDEMRTLSTWGSDFSTLRTSPEHGTSHVQGTTSKSHTDSNVGLFWVKVMYPFAARNEDELNLDEGDVIKVLRQEDEHWWIGEMKDGKQGYFPSSYTTFWDERKMKKKRREKVKNNILQ
ncbi:jouberin-like [Xenia sp. Carnegie-2017]|uniref:jouberin-like n=1 Tax=Xenia sp. Carnegie-2017 TaxID=2897299 RepID=UPI001F0422F5|nr:jouberin-like [Xenia sp. Carnegie-2017]